MLYSEYPLPPAARRHGLCLWRFTLEPDDPPVIRHVIPPDGTTSLSVTLTPQGHRWVGMAGPAARAFELDFAQGQVAAGVRLYPGAAAALLGVDPAAWIGRAGPAPRVRGDEALIDALATLGRDAGSAPMAASAFAAFCGAADDPDPIIAASVATILTNPAMTDIAGLARAAGLGERQFRRRFTLATGLSPKAFAQIQRLRNACILALAHPVSSWARVAAEAGFADQAHFNRHVARTFAVTPTELIAHIGRIRHAFADDRFVQADPEAPA